MTPFVQVANRMAFSRSRSCLDAVLGTLHGVIVVYERGKLLIWLATSTCIVQEIGDCDMCVARGCLRDYVYQVPRS